MNTKRITSVGNSACVTLSNSELTWLQAVKGSTITLTLAQPDRIILRRLKSSKPFEPSDDQQ